MCFLAFDGHSRSRFSAENERILEARAAQKTQDTKNALFGVRRFQRFLLQKRSGDEAVTSFSGLEIMQF